MFCRLQKEASFPLTCCFLFRGKYSVLPFLCAYSPRPNAVFCSCVRVKSAIRSTSSWKSAHSPDSGDTPRLPRTPRKNYGHNSCETCEACETGGVYFTLTTLPPCSSRLRKEMPRSLSKQHHRFIFCFSTLALNVIPECCANCSASSVLPPS